MLNSKVTLTAADDSFYSFLDTQQERQTNNLSGQKPHLGKMMAKQQFAGSFFTRQFDSAYVLHFQGLTPAIQGPTFIALLQRLLLVQIASISTWAGTVVDAHYQLLYSGQVWRALNLANNWLPDCGYIHQFTTSTRILPQVVTRRVELLAAHQPPLSTSAYMLMYQQN